MSADYIKKIKRTSTSEKPRIVIGNIKIKSPIEPFQAEIMNSLAVLPFEIIVVPRHPLTDDEFQHLILPKQIQFVNTIGQLEDSQASADLTIMGKIFSANGFELDDEHNPMEATINSNTICSGIMNQVPSLYNWLYDHSGLIHKCYNYDDVFSSIEKLINDPNLSQKLTAKNSWVKQNRRLYLKKVKDILIS